MLTNLQRDRIAFHMDFDAKHGLWTVDTANRLTTLNPDRELTIVGNLEDALPENTFTLEGIPLCTLTSILGRCELAFSRLSPETIDDSLLVREAGKVKLRSDELGARTKLYESHVFDLFKAVGAVDHGMDRAGWSC